METAFVMICTAVHCIITLLKPGGLRAILAETIALRIQLIAANRKLKRSPKLSPFQRLLLAVVAAVVPRNRLNKICILVKPATVLKFHRYLIKRKYSKLYSTKTPAKGRPKLSIEIKILVIEIKTKNPCFGCPQIASLVTNRTGVSISHESVRRILKEKFFGTPGIGPSWLTFLGHQVDSLWSLDFFRVESITLKSHWVMVVMDQFSRHIIGFAVIKGNITGELTCWMFNSILSAKTPPTRVSHDNDPLFKFHRWTSNMDMLEIDEVWTIPFVPISHPFCERLIGTIRREFMDKILFWNEADLARKLDTYRIYFNEARVHQGLKGNTPASVYRNLPKHIADPKKLMWRNHCKGLFRLPSAA